MKCSSQPLSWPGLSAMAIALLATLISPAQAAVDWVAPPGGVSIAVDTADNVFTVDYTYALGAEMSLSKRDRDGNLLWTASHDQTDVTKWERASWVASDSEGNALVCGTLMSGYSSPVEAASILMKFSPEGALLWRQVFESSFDGSNVKKCLVDGSNHVYVLGLATGPAGRVTAVKKFAPDGSRVWSWFDAAGIGAPLNIKFTPEGNLILSGRGTVGSINGYAKIDPQGNLLWARAGINSLTAGDVAGDQNGESYLVNGEYVASNAGTVLTKLDVTGATVWERIHGGINGFRVEVGGDNQPVVSGFPSGGVGAAFIKTDVAGNLLWSNLDADGPLGLLLHAQMLMDGQDAAYLAAGTLFEMAVCKVNADGSSAWTQTTTGGYANAMALGRFDNHLFVTGGINAARLSDTGTANLPPQAALSATPQSGTAPLVVAFSGAASLDPEGTPLSYAWNFGDGVTGSGMAASHTYTLAGNYTARLTVTDAEGASDEASTVITVTQPASLALVSSAVTLSAKLRGSTLTATGNVLVKNGLGQPVKSAVVTATWSKPGGVTLTQTATTNQAGTARFSTSGQRGTYTLTVGGISKTGYVFDGSQGVLSASITR
jgi:PKD repeat protein